MHAITAIWALVTILSYTYCQDNTSTDTLTTVPATNTTHDDAINTTISAVNATISDVKNTTNANEVADSDVVDNAVGNNTLNNDAANNLENSTMDVTTVVTTTTGPTQPVNCTTALNVKGVCVHRRKCEYSTTNIDLMLYAPRWYKKPCQSVEVCCPFDYLVEYEPVVFDEDFEFKDED